MPENNIDSPIQPLLEASYNLNEGLEFIHTNKEKLNSKMVHELIRRAGENFKQNKLTISITQNRWAIVIGKLLSDSPIIKITSYALGDMYYQERKFYDAAVYYRIALQCFKKIYDFDEVILIYYQISMCYQKADDLQATKELIQEADSYLIKSGIEKNGISQLYTNYCDFLLTKGKTSEAHKARAKFELAYKDIEILKPIMQSFGHATSLSQIGNTKDANEIFKKIEPLILKHGDAQDQATLFLNYGGNLSDSAEYMKATEYFKKAIDIYKKTGNKDGEVRARRNLASNYEDTGDYQSALEEYRIALADFFLLGDWISVGTTLSDLGVIHKNLNLYMDSIRYYLPARKIFIEKNDATNMRDVQGNIDTLFSKIHTRVSPALSEKCHHLFENKKFIDMARLLEAGPINIDEESRAFSQEDEAIIDDTQYFMEFPRDAYRLFTVACDYLLEREIKKAIQEMWSSASTFHFRYRKYERAIDMYYKAGQICEVFGRYHDLIRLGKDLGICYADAGLLEDAKNVLTETLIEAKRRKIFPVIWEVSFQLAQVYRKLGLLTHEKSHLSHAIEETEIKASTLKHIRTAEGFFADKMPLFQRYVDLLIAENQISDAYDTILKAKSWPFIHHYKKIRAAEPLEVSKFIEERKKFLPDILIKYHDLVYQDETLDNIRWLEECDDFRTLSEACEEVWSQVPLKIFALTHTNIERRIRPDCIVVDFFFSECKLHAFVIGPEGMKLISIETTQDKIVQELNKTGFFNQQQKIQSVKEVQFYIKDLFSKLFDQIIQFVPEGGRVGLCPHGILHLLPLTQCLSDVQNGQMTANHHGINRFVTWNIPHAGCINRSSEIIWDPGYSYVGFAIADEKIPQVITEVEKVGNFFKDNNRKLVLNDKASKETVLDEIRSKDIIHFACHGVVRTDFSELSYLQVGAGKHLRVIDILSKGHTRAKLVILSACSTSLGRLSSSDEIISLARAFLTIGAQSVLATLWPVRDEKSKEFILEFMKSWSIDHNSLKDAYNVTFNRMKSQYPDYPDIWSAFIFLEGQAN
jgi:tetratricopeptide (TPR) repeat protein